MSRAKTWVAGIACSAPVGATIAAVFGQRVPNLRFPGSRIDVSSPLVPARLAASIFFGIYESAEMRFVRSRLRRNLDVVELGSSIGVVACAVARRQAPGRKLVCVEANPDLIPLLRQNLAANAPGHPVSVVNRALDYDPERQEVELVFGDTNLGGSTIGRDATGRGVRHVPTARLSQLLKEHDVGPFALVADIEGAEAGIVRRDASALAACEQVVIELHPVRFEGRDEDEASLQAAFEGLGFRGVARHGCVHVFERPS